MGGGCDRQEEDKDHTALRAERDAALRRAEDAERDLANMTEERDAARMLATQGNKRAARAEREADAVREATRLYAEAQATIARLEGQVGAAHDTIDSLLAGIESEGTTAALAVRGALRALGHAHAGGRGGGLVSARRILVPMLLGGLLVAEWTAVLTGAVIRDELIFALPPIGVANYLARMALSVIGFCALLRWSQGGRS